MHAHPSVEGHRLIARDVARRGSARAALMERLTPEPTLFGDEGEPDHALVDAYRQAASAAREQETAWRKRQAHVLTILDKEYPRQLREVSDPPLVLFWAGFLMPDPSAVSIVGSRTASMEALQFAARTVHELARMDDPPTIVSGLAMGLDNAVHTAALREHMRTVAVIATGTDVAYPPQNGLMQSWIVQHGMLLSSYGPGTPASEARLLERNGLMAAYSQVSLVVEAGERSGSRVHARMALAEGRTVVLTSRVVRETRWAKSMVADGGDRVLVVRSVGEAVRAIGGVLAC